MLAEVRRNNAGKCARGACEAPLVDSVRHKHSGFLYCVACARKINRACSEDPPFRLDVR